MWTCDACVALFDGGVHRFKCDDCDDYDLCDVCYDRPSGWDKFGKSIRQHKQQHGFSQRGYKSASNVRSSVFYDLEDTALAPGTLVCLHSLHTDTELNGAHGTVQRAIVDEHGDITYRVSLPQHARSVNAPSRFVSAAAPSSRSASRAQDAHGAPPKPTNISGAVQQLRSADEFKELLAEHPIVVLAFFTDSCAPCQQMRPMFCESAQRDASRAATFAIADPSMRAFSGLASAYGVRSVPTVLHFAHGRLERSLTIVGYNPSLLETNVAQLIREAAGRQQARPGETCDLPPSYGRTTSEENAEAAEAAARAKAAKMVAKRAEVEKAAKQREQAAIEKRQAEIDAVNKQRLAKDQSPMLQKRVRAVRLVKSPELVGRIGRAVAFDGLNGRYRVEFETGGDLKALRPENLELVPEADSEEPEEEEETTTGPREAKETVDSRDELAAQVTELSLAPTATRPAAGGAMAARPAAGGAMAAWPAAGGAMAARPAAGGEQQVASDSLPLAEVPAEDIIRMRAGGEVAAVAIGTGGSKRQRPVEALVDLSAEGGPSATTADAFRQLLPRLSKRALVVGVAKYSTSPLRCSVNDAQDMHDALKRMGYQVQLVLDPDIETLLTAKRAFSTSVMAGDICLFYFAGHGVEAAVEQGRHYESSNWLIAREVPACNDDLPRFALDGTVLLRNMQDQKPLLTLMVLDCCRNNPLKQHCRGLGDGGLSVMDGGAGSFVAFACAPKKQAAEPPVGRNGIYTKHLLERLETPGLRIEDLFIDVGNAVREQSKHYPAGAQEPWTNSNLTIKGVCLS